MSTANPAADPNYKFNALQDLPPEMLDRILMKALYFTELDWVRTKQYVSNNVLPRFLVRLQTVSSTWNFRLKLKWVRIVFKCKRRSIESALSSSPVLVSRAEWLAREATSRAVLSGPVPMVIINHTVEPDECRDERSCTRAVQNIQSACMDEKGWADIPYNFLIGEDGRAYEGRGWKVHGAHTMGYNDTAIGIGFIGIFSARAPCDAALRAAQQLIRLGVREGHVAKDYSLYGHRDLRPESKSPGKYLYEIIKGWPNYKR